MAFRITFAVMLAPLLIDPVLSASTLTIDPDKVPAQYREAAKKRRAEQIK